MVDYFPVENIRKFNRFSMAGTLFSIEVEIGDVFALLVFEIKVLTKRVFV